MLGNFGAKRNLFFILSASLPSKNVPAPLILDNLSKFYQNSAFISKKLKVIFRCKRRLPSFLPYRPTNHTKAEAFTIIAPTQKLVASEISL